MFIDLTVSNIYPTFRFSSDEIVAYKARKGELLISLEKYLLDGRNILDADKIQKSIFPQHDNMFLSLILMLMKTKPRITLPGEYWAHGFR
jgi:hypothetical protein